MAQPTVTESRLPLQTRLRLWLAQYGMGTLGAVALLLIAGAALAAPLLHLPDAQAIAAGQKLRPPGLPGHLLGTDELGRDLLSRLVWGARTSLWTGALAAGLSLVIGVILGLVSGYFGGWTDTVVMRCTDIVMAFPGILLAIALAAVLGPGLTNAMVAVGIVGFPLYARLVRALVLSIKNRPYVLAARLTGASHWRIMGRHILPNVLTPLLVNVTLDIGMKINYTAGLSFLGLGTQPPAADWGNMVATGANYVLLAPHVVVIPGLVVLVTVLSLNLLGDTLLDHFDPKSSRRGDRS